MIDAKTSRVVWSKDLEFRGVVGSGYEFNLSSQAGEAGASPMEMVLASVAGCTAMDVISILHKKRQNVTGLAVEVTGLRCDEYPKVYTEMDLLYVVRGEAIEPTAVARAIELSQTKYCSVSMMLQRGGVLMRTSFRIEST